jgi:hypothetical protein
MMSGRALGHTGGTLDKLESIPGYRTDLSAAEFRRIIAETGFAMTGQTLDIVPADRLLYALRERYERAMTAGAVAETVPPTAAAARGSGPWNSPEALWMRRTKKPAAASSFTSSGTGPKSWGSGPASPPAPIPPSGTSSP